MQNKKVEHAKTRWLTVGIEPCSFRVRSECATNRPSAPALLELWLDTDYNQFPVRVPSHALASCVLRLDARLVFFASCVLFRVLFCVLHGNLLEQDAKTR